MARTRSYRGAWGVALLVGAGCSADTEGLNGTGRPDAGLADAAARLDAGATDASDVVDASVTVDASTTVDAGGAQSWIGAPCTAPNDCPSVESPNAGLHPNACMSSWPGGYCVDYCKLPDDPFVLPELARADCSPDAVCLPRSAFPGQHPREDIGACVKSCVDDEACRADEGYFCRHHFWVDGVEMLFDNGYCAPAHCASRGCPTSFDCQC